MNYQDYIASIGATAAIYAPRSTALCQGQLVSIAQNKALFSLTGTTYGGDGISTFALPDLRGVVPIGTGPSPASGIDWSLGDDPLVLAETAWPQGWPEKAGAGQTPTTPTTSGPTGLALNWAITLYGYWPPRADW